MNIEEKLQHFHDIVMEDSQAEAAAALEAHQNHLDELFEQYKKEQEQTALEEVKAESEHAFREINKALSASLLSLKQSWTREQTQKKDALFDEVRTLLEEYMATPGYLSYLEERILAAKRFAGEDEFFLYLAPRDREVLSALCERTGLSLLIAEEDFWGGLRTTIPERNILIDDSFLSSFQRLYKNFKFDGGQGL